MKNKWKSYLGWVLFTEAVGALAGWLTRDGAEFYRTQVEQPRSHLLAWCSPLSGRFYFY